MVLLIFIRHVLLEGKVDDLKEKHPQLAQEISDLSRVLKPKYLDWSVKQLMAGFSINDLIPSIQYFENNQKKFDIKDINQYKTLSDLEDLVKKHSENVSITQGKKETKLAGADRLFENDTYVLLHIKNKEASCLYGAGTKWCITMSDADYYEQYTNENIVFYFLINKKKVNRDPQHKVAFAIYRNINNNKVEKFEIFDALDKSIKLSALDDFSISLFQNAIKDAPNRSQPLAVRLVNGKFVIDELTAVAKSKDKDLQQKIIWRLASNELDIDQKQLLKILEEFLLHASRFLKRDIIDSQPPDIIAKLFPVIKMSDDPGLKIEFLLKFANRSLSYVDEKVISKNVITKEFKDDDHPEVRATVAAFYADIDTLLEMSQDKHFEVANACMTALVKIVSQKDDKNKWFERIFDLFKNHTDEYVRDLVAIDFKNKTPKINELIDDSSERVRMNAAESQLLTPESINKLAHDQNRSVRAAIAEYQDQKYLKLLKYDAQSIVLRILIQRMSEEDLIDLIDINKTLRESPALLINALRRIDDTDYLKKFVKHNDYAVSKFTEEYIKILNARKAREKS